MPVAGLSPCIFSTALALLLLTAPNLVATEGQHYVPSERTSTPIPIRNQPETEVSLVGRYRHIPALLPSRSECKTSGSDAARSRYELSGGFLGIHANLC